MPLATLLLFAAQSAPLTHTGPWVVRAEENLCLLERTYKAADGEVTLAFQPLLDLDQMEMFVLTPDGAGLRRQGEFKAGLATDPDAYKGTYVSAVLPKAKGRLTRLGTERALLDRLRDGDTLRIRAKPVQHDFVLRNPEGARKALGKCVDDLKRSWGIDPSLADRAVSTLEGDPARYFSASSYPIEALRNGIYGRVVALLNIDSQGAVEKCRIVQSAGTALNDGTCKAAMKVRFKPPRDKDGNPLASTYLLPVRWMLPGAS